MRCEACSYDHSSLALGEGLKCSVCIGLTNDDGMKNVARVVNALIDALDIREAFERNLSGDGGEDVGSTYSTF